MNEQSTEFRAVWERTRDLGQQIDGVNDRLKVLEEQNLAEHIQDLSVTVKKLAEKPKGPAFAVWNWAQFTPQQQAEAWDTLMNWVEGVFRARWPRSYKEMLGYADRPTSCWWRHPDMVESLTGLMGAYHWAYLDPEAGPLRPAEFLGRWLPDAVRQGRFILEECRSTYGGTDDGHKADPFENKRFQEDYRQLQQHIHMLRTGEVPA